MSMASGQRNRNRQPGAGSITRGWWLYLPLSLAAWTLLHASGVHPTLAGVAMRLGSGYGRTPASVRHRPSSSSAPATALRRGVRTRRSPSWRPVSLSRGGAVGLGHDGSPWPSSPAWWSPSPPGAGRLLRRRAAHPARPAPRRALLQQFVRLVACGAGCRFTVSLLIAELAFEAPAEAARVECAVSAYADRLGPGRAAAAPPGLRSTPGNLRLGVTAYAHGSSGRGDRQRRRADRRRLDTPLRQRANGSRFHVVEAGCRAAGAVPARLAGVVAGVAPAAREVADAGFTAVAVDMRG